MTLPLKKTLESLPPIWPESVLETIQSEVAASVRTIVVLDDDPTGTQTVTDVPVLTTWSIESLAAELATGCHMMFVLTNSRSLDAEDANSLAREIGRNLRTASEKTGRQTLVISRSDSTLRGHYPGEVHALTEGLGQNDRPHLVVPFFLEGGRYTIDDTHYVADGDELVPANETPFAKDATFGFKNAHMAEWVKEKFAQSASPEPTVTSITLQDLRVGGPDVVVQKLKAVPSGAVCIANAAATRDVEVLTLAAMRAEADGHPFLYRTAAGIVRSMAGQQPRSVMERDALVDPNAAAGLIVVGSYVPKTTAQLGQLLERHGDRIAEVTIDVDQLLFDDGDAAVQAAIAAVNNHITGGQHVVLSTSRRLVTGSTPEESLEIGRRVSASLISVVEAVTAPLRFLVAKGGITSSDVATKALGVKRAVVAGQILPGVPVWRLGEDSRRPGLNYVIFPGNVGDNNALADAFDKLAS